MSISNAIKKDFPIFKKAAAGKRPLVYLDSAATSQKPKAVAEAEKVWYEQFNANVHRGAYGLAETATKLYEATRAKVARFIGATTPKSIVFTKGTTEGINLVAFSWARHRLRKGSTILLTEMEHHANIVPWQLLAQEKGLTIKYWPVDGQGQLEMGAVEPLLRGVAFLALTHVSNVLGTINPATAIIKRAHEKGMVVLVDAAQSVPHMPVDVARMNPDFLVFSGHKMLGPTGVGVLYVNPERHQEMRPYQGGGDMIREVKWKSSTFKPVPWGLEAGTPPLAQVFALGKAIDYLQAIGMDTVSRHDQLLTAYAYNALSEFNEVRLYGPGPRRRSGLVSFTIEGMHAHDLATFFDQKSIAIRAGHHCAMPLHKKLGVAATARASFYIYNDRRDIDMFVRALHDIIKKWHRYTKK